MIYRIMYDRQMDSAARTSQLEPQQLGLSMGPLVGIIGKTINKAIDRATARANIYLKKKNIGRDGFFKSLLIDGLYHTSSMVML